MCAVAWALTPLALVGLVVVGIFAVHKACEIRATRGMRE